MVNIAYTPEETADEQGEAKIVNSKYPYGTSLYLDEDTLAKIGIAKLPEVGSQLRMQILVTVTSVSQRQEADGETCQNVELQVTDMEVTGTEGQANSTEQANKLYGS
jgi:hypothetical protein